MTVRSDRNMSASALEQRDAQIFFELAQLDAQRGLSNRATLGRTREAMSSAKYDYRSGLGSGFFEHGRQEGARAIVIKQLSLRFGELSETVLTKIADASIDELDAISERLLTAPTLERALGSH